jgi:hypothetical protein
MLAGFFMRKGDLDEQIGIEHAQGFGQRSERCFRASQSLAHLLETTCCDNRARETPATELYWPCRCTLDGRIGS